MAEEETGFSKEYVEKLRSEAAQWRTKYRDLESSTNTSQVQMELNKRGIKADPAWVKVTDEMSVSDAVENFAAQYPHLVAEVETPVVNTNVPRVDAPGSNSNTNVPSDKMKGRSLEEIKKDPVARAQVRERYRQLIQQSSRQVNPLA